LGLLSVVGGGSSGELGSDRGDGLVLELEELSLIKSGQDQASPEVNSALGL